MDSGLTAFQEAVDLASERLGGSVLYATDDYFAEKENLLRPSAPVWKEHEYTDRGKWMDGWESRRKRVPGHDFAIIRLGVPGVVRGIVVDTAFFRGNFPSHCSLEGCSVRYETDLDTLLGDQTQWFELLPKSELKGDSENPFAIDPSHAVSHVRLRIYPDGGVARLRVYGDAVPDWRRSGGLENEIDLAAIEHGAQVLKCSDMFFGPKHNLIMPGRAHNMSDGWETRRRRGPGHDWVIVQLATEGVVKRIEVDTNHFKGNFPDTCSIDGSPDGNQWTELLPRTKLQAHTRHMFVDELQSIGPVTHLRLNVYPDGGVSRLRVHGVATTAGRQSAVVGRLNTLTRERLEVELRRCCASPAWVQGVADARPFAGWEALIDVADRIWLGLDRSEWLDAFAAHPRIGEKKGSAWSAQEQSGTSGAAAETMSALEEVNRQYEAKFGHIYIVCATGKSADEMLELARQRLAKDAATELRAAAEEQRKITHVRLMKLV